MRNIRRTPRLKACAIGAVVAATGTLAFTGSALAATYNVTNESTFEAAVASVNAAGGANTINLAGNTIYSPASQIKLTAGTLTIQGPTPNPSVSTNAAHFTGGALTTPAPGASLFTVAAGVTVNFDSIDITTAGSAGNGVIDDSGIANLNQSTVTGQGPGLTVESGATGTLVNSTISDGLDFGIIDDGALTLTNSTVTRNPNGGIDDANGTLSLINSIVAKNGSPDCTGPVTSSDHSIDGDGTCHLGTNSLSSTNPLLGAIGNHGGSTPTDVPGVGSPAIGAGDPAACPTVDERGAARPSACDIGAVQTDTVKPVLTTANMTVGGTAAGATVTYTPTWTDAGAPVSSSCSPASGTTFPVGPTTVTCNGTDSFGNTATGTFTVTVIQATAPVVTTTPSGTETVAAVDSTGAVATFTASATDAVDGTDPVTCVPASGTKFALGNTTVTCTATDSGHLTGTATLTVDVTDQTPPVITVPSNITEVESGPTAVTYTATATDNVDGTDPVTCAPASGSVFPVATTTVTCNAHDAAGNNATPETFTVTITTTTPSSTTSTVQGEVPNGTQPGGLQITAATCEFGPVFIPGLAGTYNCTAAVSVTSTDTTTLLTINDVSTAPSVGHLVNPAGVGPANSLTSAVLDKATSPVATGSGFAALTGTATPLLNYSAPVTADPVTLAFQQAITAAEPLHNGTYGATVLLQLTGTP